MPSKEAGIQWKWSPKLNKTELKSLHESYLKMLEAIALDEKNRKSLPHTRDKILDGVL